MEWISRNSPPKNGYAKRQRVSEKNNFTNNDQGICYMVDDDSNFSFWIQWTLANAIGELVGLGTVFVAGFYFFNSFGEPQGALALVGLALLVIVLAIYEGAAVGLAQWIVLRHPLRGLSRRSWLLATIVGAVVAWILGMIPSTLIPFNEETSTTKEPAMILVLGAAAIMGAVLGVILAAAQWWVLRNHVRKALIWLLANAVAWAVAMPLIFWMVGATIGESRALGAIVTLVAGIGVAGAVVGGIHGLFLVRMLKARQKNLVE